MAVNLLFGFREDIVAKAFIGFPRSVSALYMSDIMVTRLNGGPFLWLLGLDVAQVWTKRRALYVNNYVITPMVSRAKSSFVHRKYQLEKSIGFVEEMILTNV